MKTCLLYGFISALAGAFLIMGLYLLGFQADEEKVRLSGLISAPVGFGIGLACTVLGVRARRQQVPPVEGFTYGQAFGTAFLISAVGSVLSSAFTFVFLKFINPDLVDLIIEIKIRQIEASGVSGASLDRAQELTRLTSGPLAQTILGLVLGIILGALVASVVALFLKRAPEQPPAL
jgi:hypothetical protein